MTNDDFEMINRFERLYEIRSCENCGNTECSHNYVAIHWDECVESGFTKWWKPKDRIAEKDGEHE